MWRFEGWEWEATRNTGKSVNIKREVLKDKNL